MKRNNKKLFAGILVALLCFGTAGCASQVSKEQEDSLVALNYSTGIQENGEYNSKLYGMNGISDTVGGDPGAFYVSEEESSEYGGYFYMYTTDFASVPKTEEYQSKDLTSVAFKCERSKDLHNWECVGVYDGYALGVKSDEWCQTDFWAPEVVLNPADGKYYMYFSATAKADMGIDYISSDSDNYDRLYIGVAVSETPQGPFRMICDTDTATGKKVPTINFQVGCNTEYSWNVIDVSPFFDDDGSLYLYFRDHNVKEHYNTGITGSWGMKMKSMEYADYSTVTFLAAADKAYVSNEPGNVLDVEAGGTLETAAEGINEGQFMYKHNGTYYLTYTINGYGSPTYSVYQAVGDSPLGKFTKLSYEQGNPVCDGSSLGTFNGTGHHAFVKFGDELWIVYHRHGSVFGFDNTGRGRFIAADRVKFVTNSEGQEVMTTNGPSKALQWLPEEISGYKNLAQTAEVVISTGSGVEYLTDEVLPYYAVTSNSKFVSKEGDVTVTLRWQEPVSVSSIMIYNSTELESAFSKVSDIRFKLAEQPEWASKHYDYAVIKDLELPSRYWNAETNDYVVGSPAVAEFEALKITELEFTIAEKDRLLSGKTLSLSEVVVLGKE